MTSTKERSAARELEIAVLIPCHNEAATIEAVVAGFRRHLPGAAIYVYDNRSTDDTAERAARAGAIVRREPWAGKGNVVRRMFSDIEADVYVMADGDDTYDPSAAPRMIAVLADERVDMVVGVRQGIYGNAHRAGHGLGNRLFNGLYRRLIGPEFSDIFSGYRAFSRRFVKSFPAVSSGFEIETEISVHASQLRIPVAEVETEYRSRPPGSASKLRTVRDAARILGTTLLLYKETKPAGLFGGISLALAFAAVLLAIPIVTTFLETGLVPRFPTAILATGLMLMAGISATCGLILDSVARGRLEQKRIAYLGLPFFRAPR